MASLAHRVIGERRPDGDDFAAVRLFVVDQSAGVGHGFLPFQQVFAAGVGDVVLG